MLLIELEGGANAYEATTIIAGDAAGTVWFLDGPSPNRRDSANREITALTTSALVPWLPSSLCRDRR